MTIKQLKKGTYFKVVDKNGRVGTCVYVRLDYDRSSKKYCANKFDDFNDFRMFKPSQEVTTEFVF